MEWVEWKSRYTLESQQDLLEDWIWGIRAVRAASGSDLRAWQHRAASTETEKKGRWERGLGGRVGQIPIRYTADGGM